MLRPREVAPGLRGTSRAGAERSGSRAARRPGAPGWVLKERRKLFKLGAYALYDTLSDPLRKRKTLDECAARNESFRLFVASLAEPQDAFDPLVRARS